MESSKEASRRMIEEVFGAGKVDAADELVHADAIGPTRRCPAAGTAARV